MDDPQDNPSQPVNVSRRDVLSLATAATVAPLLGLGSQQIASAQQRPRTAPTGNREDRGHNILFVFTDQERYLRSRPEGLSLLPGPRAARTAS